MYASSKSEQCSISQSLNNVSRSYKQESYSLKKCFPLGELEQHQFHVCQFPLWLPLGKEPGVVRDGEQLLPGFAPCPETLLSQTYRAPATLCRCADRHPDMEETEYTGLALLWGLKITPTLPQPSRGVKYLSALGFLLAMGLLALCWSLSSEALHIEVLSKEEPISTSPTYKCLPASSSAMSDAG